MSNLRDKLEQFVGEAQEKADAADRQVEDAKFQGNDFLELMNKQQRRDYSHFASTLKILEGYLDMEDMEMPEEGELALDDEL